VDGTDASCREAADGMHTGQESGQEDQEKEYYEYLVKWKNHPVEDASWESEAVIQSMDRPCRSSWTGAHEIFKRGSMMQEHRNSQASAEPTQRILST
jgi:hypothetical protein